MTHKKWILAVGLLLIVTLFSGTKPALAGGWASLTLSELPTEVVAERPFTIEFLLLAHGQTPLSGSDIFTEITAVHTKSGEQSKFIAEPGKEAGYYVATLTLPQAGEWRWEIEAFTAVYTMPPLTVSETVIFNRTIEANTAVSVPLVVGWLAAVGAGFFFLLWSRQKAHARLAGVILLGIISLGSFGLHWQMPQTVQAENEAATTADTIPAIAPEAMGEALFVAKGCIQCHQNGKVTMTPNLYPIGPNLTEYKSSPEFLQLWLADPTAVKPETDMPNLRLSEAEINSLVGFLTTDAK